MFSQGKPLDHTCRMVEGLDAVWANFCPSKPRLSSFIGGKKQVGQPLPGNQKYSEGRPGYVFGLDVGWIVRSGSRCCTGCACKCSLTHPVARHQAPTARSVPPPIPPLIYPPTAEPLPVNFFSIKSIVVLIYPRTAEPLPPLSPARHQAGGVFCPSMKFSHAFYENHVFYVRLLLWYTKTTSEGFRYISLRVP